MFRTQRNWLHRSKRQRTRTRPHTLRDVLAALMAMIVTAAMLTAVGLGASIASASPSVAQPPGIVDTPTGDVFAMDVVDGVSYLGGSFTGVGANTGGGALVDSTSGVVNRAAPGVQGTVNVVVSDGTGGYYIGGSITAVNGVSRNGIAHLRADGTLDPNWRPSVTGSVYAIAVSGTTIYLGGNFTAINGSARRTHVAAVDASKGAVKDWAPNPNNPVFAIVVSGSTVFLGGNFTFISGGLSRNYVAAIDATTGQAKPWNPDANFTVLDMALTGSTMYLAGQFSTINGGTRRVGAAAVDSTAGNLLEWDPQLTLDRSSMQRYGVWDLDVSGSTVYLGGSILAANGAIPRSNAAAVHAVSAVATAWNPNVDQTVYALDVVGSTVYLGGAFTLVNGSTSRMGAARVDSTTGVVADWDPNTDGTVRALHAVGPGLYIGGEMQHVNVVKRGRAAAIDATGRVTGWDPNTNGAVNELSVVHDVVYLAGEFTAVNGTTPRNRAAAVGRTDGTATAWNPDINGRVSALTISGPTAFLGGAFTTVNGDLPRNRAAAVDITTGQAKPWDPNVGGDVYDLLVAGDYVFVGGDFSTINGTASRIGVASVDTTSGLASSWNPKLNNRVTAMAVSGQTLYLIGGFGTVNDALVRNRGAAVNTTTAVATAWNPDLLHADPLTISLSGNTVYLGGQFFFANGSLTRRHAAAVDAVTGQANNWNPDFNSVVHALEAVGSTVYAAGEFTAATNDVESPPASHFTKVAQAVDSPSQFVPIVPFRAVDTRVDPGRPLGRLDYVLVDLADRVPTGTSAVAFNVTATGQTASGYINVAPAGSMIGSSTINWSRPTDTIANGHVAKLSADGRLVLLLETTGTTHIILDITGYFAPAGTPNATLYSPANRRILDSRIAGGPLLPGASRTVNINTGGSAQPIAPTAASVNVTVTGTTGSGVLTAAKDASAATSTINWTGPGQTVANAVITDVAANGNFTLTNNGTTPTQVIVDLTGTFAPTDKGAAGAQFYARNPDRTYDSRFDPAGRLPAGQARTTPNPVPPEAVAVALNATVTDTRGTGYLSVTPPGPGVPTTSTVNWFTSPTTRANGSIIASSDSQTSAYVGGSYSTQYLYDLAGYFR